MNILAEQLERDVENLGKQLEKRKAELKDLQSHCCHEWTKAEWCGTYTAGYQCQGDPEGTMGIDRQLPYYVPAHQTDEWKRTCVLCGKVEKTNKLKEHVTHTPEFR